MCNNQSSNTEDLYESFNPYFSEKSKMEVNINQHGISFVGNVEGYLAFARFFSYLAEVHMLIRNESPKPETNTVNGYGPYQFGDFISKEAILGSRYIFSPGPIKDLKPKAGTQDVLFWLSDKIGPDFWLGETESGATEDWINNYVPETIDESHTEND